LTAAAARSHADVGAGRADQRLGLWQYKIVVIGERWRRRGDIGGKSLALVGIEDRKAFEERDRVRLVAGLGRALGFPVRDEAIGIDDRGAGLALARMAAELEGLAEREPVLAGEAALGDRALENEDIDARKLRPVAAFFGRPSGAVTAPQGCTQGTRPCSSSAMILAVIC